MAKKQSKPQAVELNQLPLQALSQMKQELDGDIEYMSQSIQTLKVVNDKCVTSEECLSKLGPEAEGRELLVPLSNSVYVPGFLVDADKAIIGIGTGYYIEKNVQEAKEVFKRKEKMVQEQIEKVQRAAQEKVRLRDAVAETMQDKLATMFASQQMQPGSVQQAITK
ncbi:prefoldin subunit 5-like [Tropilaelaps mercedesae]|uniref:Prefoldin subunit 5-like n=1 Tax=Tropilaelaps mercedesae TaxID=418985 RepID=A0A1V9XHI3_9ACAR|nr:prefoldin subunit 5-like [Tropilaelaps mercedesae]